MSTRSSAPPSRAVSSRSLGQQSDQDASGPRAPPLSSRSLDEESAAATKKEGILHRLLACIMCKKPVKKAKRDWRRMSMRNMDEINRRTAQQQAEEDEEERAAAAALAAENERATEKAVDRERRLKKEEEERAAEEELYLSHYATIIQCLVRKFVAKARKGRKWRLAVAAAEEHWSKVSRGEVEKKQRRRAGREAQVVPGVGR